MANKGIYAALSIGNFTGMILEAERESVVRWLGGLPHTDERVKENGARSVWSAIWRVRVFIKKYKAESFAQRVRLMLLPSRAEREFDILRRLSAVHVPVPFPIGYIVAGDGSYLITRAIDDAVSLKDHLLESPPDGRTMNRLIRHLAVFVRELLDIGIHNRDLHIGNILVDRRDHARLSLIDLQRTTWKRHLSRRGRMESVAFLTLSSLRFLTRIQTIRLIAGALGDRDRGLRHDLVRGVLDRIVVLRDHYYRRHENRCFKEGSGFEVRRESGRILYLRKGIDVAAALTALDTHRQGGNQMVKILPNRRLTRFGKNLFVKEFRRPAGIMTLARMVGKDHGLRLWRMHQAMAIRDLPAPPCHLLAVTGSSSFVVGEWIDGALPLNDYLKERWGSASIADRRRLIAALAELVRRMLALGLYHRDLKANNIIVRDSGVRPEFFILDGESIRRHKIRRWEEMDPLLARGLAQLNAAVTPPVTKGDRLRFFRIVTARRGPLTAADRRLILDIQRRTLDRHHLWPNRH